MFHIKMQYFARKSLLTNTNDWLTELRETMMYRSLRTAHMNEYLTSVHAVRLSPVKDLRNKAE